MGYIFIKALLILLIILVINTQCTKFTLERFDTLSGIQNRFINKLKEKLWDFLKTGSEPDLIDNIESNYRSLHRYGTCIINTDKSDKCSAKNFSTDGSDNVIHIIELLFKLNPYPIPNTGFIVEYTAYAHNTKQKYERFPDLTNIKIPNILEYTNDEFNAPCKSPVLVNTVILMNYYKQRLLEIDPLNKEPLYLCKSNRFIKEQGSNTHEVERQKTQMSDQRKYIEKLLELKNKTQNPYDSNNISFISATECTSHKKNVYKYCPTLTKKKRDKKYIEIKKQPMSNTIMDEFIKEKIITFFIYRIENIFALGNIYDPKKMNLFIKKELILYERSTDFETLINVLKQYKQTQMGYKKKVSCDNITTPKPGDYYMGCIYNKKIIDCETDDKLKLVDELACVKDL